MRLQRAVIAVAGASMLLTTNAAYAAQTAAPTARTLAGPRPAAAAARGWHQLLKIRHANLYTIAATGRNAWVAGYRVLPATSPHPLLEHWDGRAWHAVRLPARLDTPSGGIDEVAASSPRNVWIFINHAGKNLVARWNGRRWQTRTPQVSLLSRGAVTFGTSDTWDFGTFGVGHFTASGWHISPLAVSVTGVSAVSRRDIWAFGFPSSAGKLPIGAHWNGLGWTYEQVPRTVLPKGFTQLLPGGIHGFGPSDAWAVGTALTPKDPTLGVPVVLHWNGHSWRRAYAGPAGQFGSLSMITSDRHGDLWMTSDFIAGMLLREHHGRFSWIPGPQLGRDQFQASDLTWMPGTQTLLLTGFLASEVTVQNGHVESYSF